MKINEELSNSQVRQAIISIRNIREKAKHDRQTFCRICLENTQPLIRPCNTCDGSQAYVHPECLYMWRTQFSMNDRRYKYCELCRTPYKVHYKTGYENYITILNICDIIQFALFITYFILLVLFLSMDEPYIHHNPYRQIILSFLNFSSIQLLTVIITREITFNIKLVSNNFGSYIFGLLSFFVFALNVFGQLHFSIKLTSIAYCLNTLIYAICGAQWKCYIQKLRTTQPR